MTWFALWLLLAAPSADEVLDKARKAIGDVSNLKSLSIAGVRRVSVVTPDGPGSMSRDSEVHMLLPDKFLRSESLELPGGIPGPTVVEALDGDTSWREVQNTPTGANVIMHRGGPGGVDDETARTRTLRAQYLRNTLLYTLTAPAGMDVKFEYTGEAESPDGKAWIIDAKGPNGFDLRVFIDQKSHLPVMATWRGMQAGPVMRMMRMEGPPPASSANLPRPEPKEVEFELRLSDHAKFGGILLPKVMTTTVDGKLTEEFELKSAKWNPNLKPEKFRK